MGKVGGLREDGYGFSKRGHFLLTTTPNRHDQFQGLHRFYNQVDDTPATAGDQYKCCQRKRWVTILRPIVAAFMM